MTETERCIFSEQQVQHDGRENDASALNPAVQEYNHAASMNEVENMFKELEALKEKITKNNVRCHMLQVDLATQFSPHTIDTIRSTNMDCKRCTTKLQTELHVSKDQNEN